MKSKTVLFCIFETFIVNLGVYIIFFLRQPNQEVYLNLNPHPLLILSIIMGMRYGNYLGIISATISTYFYVNVFLEIYGDFELFLSYFSNYKYPLLFFWSGIIFGFFKDNHKAEITNLTTDKNSLEKRLHILQKNNVDLGKAYKELKNQITGSEESILNLYQIASRLETLDSEEVFTETMGILLKFLKAEAISIYTYHEESGYLRLKIRTGNKDIDCCRSLKIDESTGFTKVVYQQRTLKWSDVEEPGFPLMSAPLIKDGKVLAVVNVVDMEFDKLSEYAWQLFKLIIAWVNKALAQAIYVDSLKGSKYYENTRIYLYQEFEKRVAEEKRREKEFGMPFGLLQFELPTTSLQEIESLVAGLLRKVDIVTIDEEKNILKVLLPATPKNQLPVIEERISNRLAIFSKESSLIGV